MLKLSALEFFFRTIPESFLIVTVAYIFSNRKISKPRFTVASLILSIITYLVRLLPISIGVNTIINMIVFIIIGVCILKMSINTSIFSVFISVVTLSFCEWSNAFIIFNILNIKNFSSTNLMFIYYMPSLAMFMLIVLILYIFVNKIKRI